jgi:hypothetical protein
VQGLDTLLRLVLIGTKRIDGLLTASQIASASFALWTGYASSCSRVAPH